MADFGIFFAVAGLQLISSALTPPQSVGKLENRSLPEASYGSEIPLGYGLFPFRGILTHLPPELTETRNRRGKIGGKVTEFSYSATMEFILSEGPIVGLPYVTLNGEKFIDLFSEDVKILEDSKTALDQITIRTGTATQLPVGALEAIARNSIAPPNRGLAFLVLPDWPLTETLGNRPPLVQGLAATSGTITTLAYNAEAPMPIQWGGAIASDLSLKNVARFTGTQSTTFTPPISYTYHVVASNPVITLSRGGIVYTLSHNGTHWARQVDAAAPVNLLAMPSDQVAQGVFFDIEIGDDFDIYLHGVLLTSFPLNPGTSHTLQIQSTNWAGLEVPKSTNTEVSIFTPATVPLSGILKNICDRAGIICNVTEITDLVTGVGLTGDSPSDWIGQLQSIYAFLIVDKGGVIHFLNGDRPPEAFHTAPLTDFGLNEGDLYQIEQKSLEELPYQCEVRYYDLADHQEKSAYYRLDSHSESDRPLSEQILSINTGSVMTQSEARGIAELTLIRVQHERETITLNTNFDYYFLEPGDVIRLPLFGQSIDLLVLEANLGANYQIEFKCLRYARDAWAAKVTPTLSNTTPTQSAQEYARLFLQQSLPKLSASHPDNPLYMAVSHQLPAYRSVAAIGSIDSGNSYAQLFTQNAAALVGVSNALNATDTSMTVRVSGTLATISNATYANNLVINRCVIAGEVIQYQNADLLGSFRGWNYYRISIMRRAQLGTVAVNHQQWAQFGLAADLTPIERDSIGSVGTAVLVDLLTDRREQPLPEASITLA